MEFCTSIHCIDGRIQEKIVKYLKEKYNIKYVDSITEPGPCYVLSENTDHNLVDAILRKVDISINNHGSKVIAISGHFDCAGNPVSKEEQEDHIKKSLRLLKSKYKDLEVIGFYINDQWEVEEELKFEMVI
jgi:carbonic anhydrase